MGNTDRHKEYLDSDTSILTVEQIYRLVPGSMCVMFPCGVGSLSGFIYFLSIHCLALDIVLRVTWDDQWVPGTVPGPKKITQVLEGFSDFTVWENVCSGRLSHCPGHSVDEQQRDDTSWNLLSVLSFQLLPFTAHSLYLALPQFQLLGFGCSSVLENTRARECCSPLVLFTEPFQKQVAS